MYLCTRKTKNALLEDPLAQLVEHNTFNVGVLGSSPKRITKGALVRVSFFVCLTLIALLFGFIPIVLGQQKSHDLLMVYGRKANFSFLMVLIKSGPNIRFHNLLFRLLIFLIVINSKSNRARWNKTK